MKHITLLLIIILTFSCSSEEENKKEDKSENYKIYKIKSTNEDGDINITEINYKNGLLDFIKMHNSDETIIEYYNYNSRGQIISITSDSGNETTFSYTGSNITKQNYSEDSYDEYSYDNSNNNVKTKKIYRNNLFLYELLYEYDNKNNMVKITELNSGQTSTSSQTFDDKKNPFLNVLPKELLVINLLNGENNVLESHDDETFVYEYNSDGFPIKQTIYEAGNLESVLEFEYK